MARSHELSFTASNGLFAAEALRNSARGSLVRRLARARQPKQPFLQPRVPPRQKLRVSGSRGALFRNTCWKRRTQQSRANARPLGGKQVCHVQPPSHPIPIMTNPKNKTTGCF